MFSNVGGGGGGGEGGLTSSHVSGHAYFMTLCVHARCIANSTMRL